MTGSWEQALEDFGARLAEQRAALDAGALDADAPFAPPPSLGPFPPSLRGRAAELLQDALELQARLQVSLSATGRELQVVRRLAAASSTAPRASYLDQAL